MIRHRTRLAYLGLAFSFILMLMLAACGRRGPAPTPTPTVNASLVESVDILILESFPVQVHAVVRGNLPDGCTEIDEITQTRDDNQFELHIRTIRPTDTGCTLALAPFEEVVPLDVVGLKAGIYLVTVDGVTNSFELSTDNVLVGTPY
jgi:inhibitor of cysteine peptidase